MSANDDSGSKQNYSGSNDDAAYFDYIPKDVIHAQVHPSIKVIREQAFLRQSLLMSVELHDGIEVIEKEAFYECCSLCKILSPPLVRAIKERAFSYCEWLTTAILNDGLEEIGEYAFSGCALVCIDIPPSIRVIKYCAFHVVVARGYSHVSRNYYVETGHVSIVLYYVRPSSVRIKR
jgi:hypothetical protein